MWWIPIAVSTLLCMELYDYYLLRRQSGWARLVLLPAIVIGSLAWPYLVPAHLPEARFVFALVAFNKIIKSVEVAFNRVCDPRMLESFGKYLVWSMNFPDCFWPQDRDEAARNRREGLSRLVRSIPKIALSGGLLALSTAVPQLHDYYYVSMLWLACLSYTAFTGTCDCVTGFVMLAGVRLTELFDAPFLARSPRDFWGRRWNLYFRDVAHRNIFVPLGGVRRAVPGVCLVFAMSAALHEYIIGVSAGWSMLGYMTAFFAVHCAATISQTALGRYLGKKTLMPRPPAVLLHVAWMVGTLPLLMEPLLLVFPCTTWHLW